MRKLLTGMLALGLAATRPALWYRAVDFGFLSLPLLEVSSALQRLRARSMLGPLRLQP